MSMAFLASLSLAGCVTAGQEAIADQNRVPTTLPHPARIVAEEARNAGVPVNLALAVMKVESGGRCEARNRHAVGLMQTLPRTARAEGVTGPLTDCRNGARAGVLYLRRAISMHGPGCAGASAYNRGVHAPGRCSAYGMKVMRLARGAG